MAVMQGKTSHHKSPLPQQTFELYDARSVSQHRTEQLEKNYQKIKWYTKFCRCEILLSGVPIGLI